MKKKREKITIKTTGPYLETGLYLEKCKKFGRAVRKIEKSSQLPAPSGRARVSPYLGGKKAVQGGARPHGDPRRPESMADWMI